MDRKNGIRSLIYLAGAVGTLAVASAVYQVLGERTDARRHPPPGRLVAVRGRRLHVWDEGPQDKPAIVVATGTGSTCLEWATIQRRLVPDHRVVLIDRGGLGWSEWVPGRRSASALADELFEMLQAANIPGPYVLVGHSLGGLIVRFFHARQPELVAGMVLVEASHEASEAAIRAEFGRELERDRWKRIITRYLLRPRGVERARVRLLGHRYYHDWAAQEVPQDLVETSVALDLTSRRRREVVAELLHNGRSKKDLEREARDLGDLPLAVISRTPTPVESYGSSGQDEFLTRWLRLWMPLQRQLATLSTNSRHLTSGNGGHYVHLDDPALVVTTLKEICADLETPSSP